MNKVVRHIHLEADLLRLRFLMAHSLIDEMATGEDAILDEMHALYDSMDEHEQTALENERLVAQKGHLAEAPKEVIYSHMAPPDLRNLKKVMAMMEDGPIRGWAVRMGHVERRPRVRAHQPDPQRPPTLEVLRCRPAWMADLRTLGRSQRMISSTITSGRITIPETEGS